MKVSVAALLLPIGIAAGFTAPGRPAAKTSTALYANWFNFGGAAPPAEKKGQSQKNHHFKSRSLVDFQKDLEAGKVRHQFPVMFAKERIAKGKLRPSDVPVSVPSNATSRVMCDVPAANARSNNCVSSHIVPATLQHFNS